MNVKLTVLLVTLIITSCNSNEHNFRDELSKENLVKRELESLKIKIMIPKECTTLENNDNILIDCNPKGRAIKQFSISKIQSTLQEDQYDALFSFENGATVQYYMFEGGGGSGGTEYQLEGVFKIEDKTLLITSSDQKEFGKGEPEFCLKYLSTVEIIKRLPAKDKMN